MSDRHHLVFSVLLACVMPAAAASAQDDAHAACVATGWVPREILDRPVSLRPATGNAHEVVSTKSKEAQAFYDQGLNYLHGYVWIEAARSFRQALRHDPDLAMAWVGLSRVYSGLDDPKAARLALQEAQARADKASPRERRRIAVRAKQAEALDDLTNAARHAEYKKAIDDALAADIGDPELWLIRGNAEEGSAAGRGQRGAAASTAFYLEALRLSPDNAAAHHYLTHSYETIGQITLALEHGEVYARLAASIPHAHHMWGHDLRRVGRIDDAIAAFKKTDQLERAYFAAEGIARELDWHHLHNLDLLATAYQHKGQMRLAEATMREAVGIPPVTEYAAYNRRIHPLFLLTRGRAEEALLAARELQAGKWAAERAMGHAMAGQALLAIGRSDEARGALASAEAEMDKLGPPTSALSVTRRALEPYADVVRGELLLRSGQAAEGRAILKAVQQALRAIPGPDAWIQALFRLETIGRVARNAGDWDLAEHTAVQMMEHDAAYGGSRYAAGLVARHKGDAARAATELRAAESYWRDADPDLPELRELRELRQHARR